MTRPGSLVHAEHEARNEAERNGWDEDYLPNQDEAGPPQQPWPSTPIAEVEAAIARARQTPATTGESA